MWKLWTTLYLMHRRFACRAPSYLVAYWHTLFPGVPISKEMQPCVGCWTAKIGRLPKTKFETRPKDQLGYFIYDCVIAKNDEALEDEVVIYVFIEAATDYKLTYATRNRDTHTTKNVLLVMCGSSVRPP